MTIDSPTGMSFESTLQEMRAKALKAFSESDPDRKEATGSAPLTGSSVQGDPRVEQIKQKFGNDAKASSSEVQEKTKSDVSDLKDSGESGVLEFRNKLYDLRKEIDQKLVRDIDNAFESAIELGEKNPNLQPEIVRAVDLISNTGSQVSLSVKGMLNSVEYKMGEIVRGDVAPAMRLISENEAEVSRMISVLF